MSERSLTLLLGGTFDPIHNGHLHIADSLNTILHPHDIQFIPNYQSADDKQHAATAQQRLEMVTLAIHEKNNIHVNDTEVRRQGKSYTFDTIYEIKQQLPHSELAFVLGSDAFARLNTWNNYQQTLDLCHFIIVDRPNFKLEQATWLKSLFHQGATTDITTINQSKPPKILLLDIPPMDISATRIRHDIQKGKDISHLVPQAVADYIQRHHIYQD